MVCTQWKFRFGFTNDPDGYLLLKISQLIELLEIRHSVFLMGNPGSSLTQKQLGIAMNAIPMPFST